TPPRERSRQTGIDETLHEQRPRVASPYGQGRAAYRVPSRASRDRGRFVRGGQWIACRSRELAFYERVVESRRGRSISPSAAAPTSHGGDALVVLPCSTPHRAVGPSMAGRGPCGVDGARGGAARSDLLRRTRRECVRR